MDFKVPPFVQEAWKKVIGALAARYAQTDDVQSQFKVRTHLEKFDGSAPKLGETKQPIEYIIVENGKIVHREIHGKPVPVDSPTGGS